MCSCVSSTHMAVMSAILGPYTPDPDTSQCPLILCLTSLAIWPGCATFTVFLRMPPGRPASMVVNEKPGGKPMSSGSTIWHPLT